MSSVTDTRAPALDRRRPPTPWSSHFAVVRAHPWLILAATALTMAVSAVYVASVPRRYEAHAQLLVSVSPNYQPVLQDLGMLLASADPSRPAQTIAWLAMTQRVATYASTTLGGDPSPRAVASDIVAQPVGSADVVDIAATGSSPAAATALANAAAAGVLAVRAADLRTAIDRLLTQLQAALPGERRTPGAATATAGEIGDLQTLRMVGDPGVHLLQNATTPSVSRWPTTNLILAGAGLVGLLVGVLGAFGVESRDPRLRSSGQLPLLSAGSVIATIPPAKRGRGHRPRCRRGPVTPDLLDATAAEQIRTLSHRLVRHHRVLLTGASGSEGRTTVALALAQAAALAGRETILLEVDVRSGALGDALGLHAYSTQDVFRGTASLRVALETPDGFSPRLRVLPGGRAPTTLADLPEPRQLVDLIQQASELADLVIVDTPPLGVVGDGVPLVAGTDLALMVVRIGATRLHALAQASAELDGVEHATVIVGRRPAKRRDRRLLPVSARTVRA